jgi:polyketide biosynthesis enoyl-CoA hydratase PksI
MSEEFTLSYPDKAIAVIQQNVKNFSESGNQEKVKLFEMVARNDQAKVLIMTGNGKFYSRGGDQKIMLDIVSQKTTFADFAGYKLYLDFPLPIITAMQGHAFGGGFTEGFYSEMLILSEISIYSASFMKYGFTPGMGSTFLLPYYLGNMLGWEMLFTAKDYTGEELKNRGASVQVVEQKKVLSTALKEAAILAKMPKTSLQLLKAHKALVMLEKIHNSIELELKMHEKCMGNSHVLESVKMLFKNLKEE